MKLNFIEKMLSLVLITVLVKGLPLIHHYHTNNDQNKIIFGSPLIMEEYSKSSPISTIPPLIFPDDRIYFPAQKEEKSFRYQTGRFTPLPKFNFRNLAGQPVELSQNIALKEIQKSVDQPPSDVPLLSGQLPASPAFEVNPIPEKIENNSDKFTFPEKQDKESNRSTNTIPISWLEKWLRTSLTNTTTEENGTSQSQNTVNTDETSEETKIAFQSLFQIPSLVMTKGKDSSCPPNERRNHYGMCIRPFRIVVIEDDLTS